MTSKSPPCDADVARRALLMSGASIPIGLVASGISTQAVAEEVRGITNSPNVESSMPPSP
ncbi:hypothetical protein [Neoroseomonas lacus]|uniref:Uncharacterized protein n=1 Tax=Neoroseomonas lacus TaxID=287609 RepID=A0A917NTU5_9PROT|nr:hypothetical protein [Neoroseomonas lacus]GGJ27960.1 hypothetical protein GCM10011320_39050 [Neoroseomonas lacus]